MKTIILAAILAALGVTTGALIAMALATLERGTRR